MSELMQGAARFTEHLLCVWQHPEWLTSIHVFNPYDTTISGPNLQMRKLRSGEVKRIGQGHRANETEGGCEPK